MKRLVCRTHYWQFFWLGARSVVDLSGRLTRSAMAAAHRDFMACDECRGLLEAEAERGQKVRVAVEFQRPKSRP